MSVKKRLGKIKIVKKRTSITKRIYLIFAVIVVLFSIIVLRLAQMQILNKSFYDTKLNSSTTYKVTSSSPRGQIFDAAETYWFLIMLSRSLLSHVAIPLPLKK